MSADDVTTANDETFSLSECVAGGVALAAIALIAFVGLPRVRSQTPLAATGRALATSPRPPAPPSGSSTSGDAFRGDNASCLSQATNSDDGCSLRGKPVRKRQTNRRPAPTQFAPTHLAKRPQ
jgi:hypothetical protein